MDRKAATTQIARACAVTEKALTAIERLSAEVSRQARQIPNEKQTLSRAVKRLRGASGKELDDLRKEYDRRAGEREPVPELNKAITLAARRLNKWVDDGFGEGSQQKWLTMVEDNMTVDPGETRDDQCTLARQQIRVEFGGIDSSLAHAIKRLHEAVAEVLRSHLTTRLVPAERPLETLLETARRLELETLCSALEDLLRFGDSYGSVFLRVGGPVVRQIRPVGGSISGDYFAPAAENEPTPHQGNTSGPGPWRDRARKAASAASTAHMGAASAVHPGVAVGVVAAQVAAPIIAGWIWNALYSDDSAAGLHEALSKAVREAVKQIEDLMQEEAGQLSAVLAASMSQFFDRFARTPDVEDEWIRLCGPLRQELWSKTFGAGAGDLAARLRQLGQATDESEAAARDFLAATAAIGSSDARS